MAITANLIKELREKTGAGMMDCKKALQEVGGDIEKGIEFLREKGLASAGKKASRVAAEGAVGSFISEDGKVGSLVEVNCETDFVAKNDTFQQFVKNVATFIGTNDKADITLELEEMAKGMIANIGENVVVRRFEKYTLTDNGILGEYIHLGGKIGVLLQLDCDASLASKDEIKALIKDMAMQIAASNPTYLEEKDVPNEEIEKEKTILLHQALNEGKPENIAEKMVEGRIKKMYKEICLIEQPFVKDPDKTVKALLSEKSKELGSPISIKKFTRYQMGEGLEKKTENFAEEIAKQLG